MLKGKICNFFQCRSRCLNVTNILQRDISRNHPIWSLRVISCHYLSLAYHVLEFQAGGPDVWHDTQIKIKQLGLFLTSCAQMCLHLMCGIKGRDRVAFRVLMWRVSNSRAATYPVPLVQPPSTPQWLIRNVSGITLSAGQGRGQKYLQSSQEGNSLIVDLQRVASSAFEANGEWEYSTGPFNVKSCGNDLNDIKSTIQASVWNPDLTCLHANGWAAMKFPCSFLYFLICNSGLK